MKTFNTFLMLVGLTAAMSACSSCAADTKPADELQTVENDLETMVSENPVRSWTGSRIAPDATLPVVIDFNADWCGPCRLFAPVFEETAKRYSGKAIFMSVNVDVSPRAAHQFGVTSIPQVSVLMPDGTVRSTVGYMDEAALSNFLGL